MQSGSWKRRHCVLDGRRLFFYQSESAAVDDKTAHYIDLLRYDICEEDVVIRGRRRSSSSSSNSSPEHHVLVISSADIEKGSHRFFETVKKKKLSIDGSAQC